MAGMLNYHSGNPKTLIQENKNRLEFRHAKICKILRHANVMQDLIEYHKDTHSLYVVLSIHLLVLRVRTIIACTQRQKHNIFFSGFLQS